MGDKLEETEAVLQINKAELKAALEREKPTRGSQKILSKPRPVTTPELANPRHIHSTGRRTRCDAGSSPPPKPPTKRGGRGRSRRTRGGRSGGPREDASNAEPSSDAANGGDHPAPPEHFSARWCSIMGKVRSWAPGPWGAWWQRQELRPRRGR